MLQKTNGEGAMKKIYLTQTLQLFTRTNTGYVYFVGSDDFYLVPCDLDSKRTSIPYYMGEPRKDKLWYPTITEVWRAITPSEED